MYPGPGQGYGFAGNVNYLLQMQSNIKLYLRVLSVSIIKWHFQILYTIRYLLSSEITISFLLLFIYIIKNTIFYRDLHLAYFLFFYSALLIHFLNPI